MLLGSDQKGVILAWNPRNPSQILDSVLSSLLTKSSKIQLVSPNRLEVVLSESNTLISQVKQSLTIGLDGKLYASLVEGFAASK